MTFHSYPSFATLCVPSLLDLPLGQDVDDYFSALEAAHDDALSHDDYEFARHLRASLDYYASCPFPISSPPNHFNYARWRYVRIVARDSIRRVILQLEHDWMKKNSNS